MDSVVPDGQGQGVYNFQITSGEHVRIHGFISFRGGDD